jgi:hypothetical protein
MGRDAGRSSLLRGVGRSSNGALRRKTEMRRYRHSEQEDEANLQVQIRTVLAQCYELFKAAVPQVLQTLEETEAIPTDDPNIDPQILRIKRESALYILKFVAEYRAEENQERLRAIEEAQAQSTKSVQ